MMPYCGWIRARKIIGRQTCKMKGPYPSWHRPEGINEIETIATWRALKKSERQQAQAEIRTALREWERNEWL